jgi:hypothetical protein
MRSEADDLKEVRHQNAKLVKSSICTGFLLCANISAIHNKVY